MNHLRFVSEFVYKTRRMIFKCRDEYQSRADSRSALVSILVGLAVLVVLAILVVLVELYAKRLELWASCNESSTCLVGGIVSVRENQRIRRRIVHRGR